MGKARRPISNLPNLIVSGKAPSLAVTGVTLPRDVCYSVPWPVCIERIRVLLTVMA